MDDDVENLMNLRRESKRRRLSLTTTRPNTKFYEAYLHILWVLVLHWVRTINETIPSLTAQEPAINLFKNETFIRHIKPDFEAIHHSLVDIASPVAPQYSKIIQGYTGLRKIISIIESGKSAVNLSQNELIWIFRRLAMETLTIIEDILFQNR